MSDNAGETLRVSPTSALRPRRHARRASGRLPRLGGADAYGTTWVASHEVYVDV